VILKSSRRAGSAVDAAELLAHLLHGAGNEFVREIGLPGCTARALGDARLAARDSRDAAWHLSVNPAVPLTEAQWARAGQVVRDAYSLPGDLPMTWVEHSKPHRPAVGDDQSPRPPHRHVIFPSWDPVSGRRINPFRHYVLNERVARQLEHEFGHPLTKGKHNRAVASWCVSHGLAGLAAAMDMAGLLDGPAPVQAVSDGERRVGARRGRDAFAAADASGAAAGLASAEPISRGAAFIAEMARQGFIVAQGDPRLVLVPRDGGKAVGAARKAKLTEAALRDLLGEELGRLPPLGRDADTRQWLKTLSPDNATTGEPNHVDEEREDPAQRKAGPAVDEPGRGRRAPRDGGASGRDAPAVRPARTVPDDLRAPSDRRDDREDGGSAGGAGVAAGGRGPPGAGAGSARGDRRISEVLAGGAGTDRTADGEPGGRPRADRRRVECALLSGALSRSPQAHRLASLTAALRPPRNPAALAPEEAPRLEWEAGEQRATRLDRPETRRAVILLHPAIRPDGSHRRRLAAAMRRAYDSGWVPESVTVRLRDVRVDGDTVVLTLVTGSRILDRPDSIEIFGQADDVAVSEIVEAVGRKGWPMVAVQGSMDFRVAAAKALLALDPPIRVERSPLSEFEEAEIEDARHQKASLSPTALAGFTDKRTDRSVPGVGQPCP
jgi:hypothetical protein